MLILDIPCEQFGDKCKLEGFFVPFGHRDGKCIFIDIYIYIGYMLPTLASISHIRSHQSQYINHINQSYQKPPDKMSKGGHSDYWQNVFLTKRLTWIRPDKTSKVVRHSPEKTPKVVRPSWRYVILTKRLPDETSADRLQKQEEPTKTYDLAIVLSSYLKRQGIHDLASFGLQVIVDCVDGGENLFVILMTLNGWD